MVAAQMDWLERCRHYSTEQHKAERNRRNQDQRRRRAFPKEGALAGATMRKFGSP